MAAMMVLPPGLLSTMTCCFQRSASFCPRARANPSALPPGAKDTMRRTGRVGQLEVCAAAFRTPAPQRTSVASLDVIDTMDFLYLLIKDQCSVEPRAAAFNWRCVRWRFTDRQVRPRTP